jgi:hypothetical protein
MVLMRRREVNGSNAAVSTQSVSGGCAGLCVGHARHGLWTTISVARAPAEGPSDPARAGPRSVRGSLSRRDELPGRERQPDVD